MSADAVPFSDLIRGFFRSEEGVRFFLSAVENLPMALLLFSVHGDVHRLVYLNRAARPVDRPLPDDLLGRPAMEAFRVMGPDLERVLRTATAQREPLHISEYASGDGRVWEGDVHPIIGPEGVVTHVVLMATDVTNSSRSREVARQEQAEATANLAAHTTRIEELEKVKSDFLNLASHELRGPLALLRGYISMLADGSLGDLPPEAAAVLPTLQAKSSQMALLITQMLEAARLEDSRLHLDVEIVDMRTLVRGAVGTMAALARPGQAVMFRGAAQPLPVIGDRLRLENIVLNLLDNALKYSPGGGEIGVLASRRRGNALITVRDHGIGIAAADMPRLFSRFGRLVTADNSHIPGTGLGLYLSRELARMHGGDIEAHSELGVGSAFVLKIPLQHD